MFCYGESVQLDHADLVTVGSAPSGAALPLPHTDACVQRLLRWIALCCSRNAWCVRELVLRLLQRRDWIRNTQGANFACFLKSFSCHNPDAYHNDMILASYLGCSWEQGADEGVCSHGVDVYQLQAAFQSFSITVEEAHFVMPCAAHCL